MRRAALACALLLAAGCGGSEPALRVPEASPGDWPVATLEEVGLDRGRVTALVERRRTQGTRRALLIARGGRLAVEEYFHGSGPDSLHSLQSVTKSVTSLLIGIAADQGRLPALDSPVLDLLPCCGDLRGGDPRRDALNVRHLLGMRGGLEWHEDPYAGSDLETLNRSHGDWVRFVLDRTMRETPGTSWQYNSGGVIVLSGVLRASAQLDPAEFARTFLFEPLGIRTFDWFRAPFDGLPHTGGGLSLRARDMAKLGELVLRRGRWAGRPVVSEEWIEASTARVTGPLNLWPRPVYYGYLWWLFPRPDGPDVLAASGAGGQWIFVVRDLDLVVAVTSDPQGPDFFSPVEDLFGDILPAVVRPAD